MISLPVYLRLWRLHASNQHLLKMYYSLYYEVKGEESKFYKSEFSNRINHREKINEELEAYLKNEMPFEEDSRYAKAVDRYFPVLFSMEYGLQNIFSPLNLEKCRTYEIKNIEQYYEFLYSGTGKEEITDLLLDQKSVIENSVFSEI